MQFKEALRKLQEHDEFLSWKEENPHHYLAHGFRPLLEAFRDSFPPGVINIVTLSKFNGLAVEASVQAPEIGAGTAQRYSITAGTSGVVEDTRTQRLARLVEWLHHGPPAARVDEVSVTPLGEEIVHEEAPAGLVEEADHLVVRDGADGAIDGDAGLPLRFVGDGDGDAARLQRFIAASVKNADRIQARLIVEGANGPTTPEARRRDRRTWPGHHRSPVTRLGCAAVRPRKMRLGAPAGITTGRHVGADPGAAIGSGSPSGERSCQ